MQSWQDIIDSPVCAAIAVGLYVSVFYIMTNFTMLPPSSMLVLAGALIIPVTAVVCLVYATLSALGKDAYARQVAIFLCAVYLMILMRAPVFNIRGLAEAFQGFGEPARMAINCIYYIVPALLISFIFRNNVGKFALVMSAMTLAAFVGNFSVIGESLKDKDRDFGNDMAASLQDVTLGSTPNIYFIIADGYSSFAYMEENGIDVSGFRGHLADHDFRLYDDVFSNYHSTSNAMPAMLNMDHHYYALNHSHRSGEVRKDARIIIGGRNNLVDLMRRNNYEVQYLHNWPILLLHGCSADYCYGEIPFAGAKLVLREILPFPGAKPMIDDIWWLFTRRDANEGTDLWVEWSGEMKQFGVRHSLQATRQEVVRLIEENAGNANSGPIFQYIHLAAPSHAPDSKVGICDEDEQLDFYARRISEINPYLQDLIDDIVSRDPKAVILLSGDHGPFIADKCSRWTDLSTKSDYRDRMAVITAIRWPEGYDGRFDDQIVTTINLFRYLLATLATDQSKVLDKPVLDDVFIQGERDILKIMADGNLLIPPEHYTSTELKATHQSP